MKVIVDAREAYTHYPNLVVLITSVDEGGQSNVMTGAWAMQLGREPPLFGVAMRPSRYTYELIGKTGEFVVNVPPSELQEAVKFCGENSGRDVDKFEKTELTPVPARTVKAPWIEECVMHIECKVKKMVELGERVLVVGNVTGFYLDRDDYNRENLIFH